MKQLVSIFLFFVVTGISLSAQSISDTYSLEYQKNYSKALEIMETLAKDKPKNYFIQLRTSWVAYLKGEFPKSNSYSEKAILLSPKAVEPRISQIRALMALAQYRQVTSSCADLLKIDPKNYYGRSMMAFANYSIGNFKEAEKYYSSIVSDYPGDTEMLIGLAWSFLKQGNKKSAKEYFEQLSEIIPNEERVKSGLSHAEN